MTQAYSEKENLNRNQNNRKTEKKYRRTEEERTVPCSANGYITSLWQASRGFTFCFPVVLIWEVCFCLLLCLRPTELICCKSGSPLVVGVPVWLWKLFVAKGVFPYGWWGLSASPFLAFAVPGWMVFPTSPSARLGVAKGALLDWKDFEAPKLLPVQN